MCLDYSAKGGIVPKSLNKVCILFVIVPFSVLNTNKGINNMDDNLNSISEIMKPTHLQKINPIPRDKSMVPFGFGIIPTGKFVQYNKDMIPYKEYIKLLRVAIKLNTYFLQDVSDMDTVVASMEIKNLQGKHQKRLYDK